MLEVLPVGDRWTWVWLCARGRVLMYTAETWPTDREAFAAAKAYRTAFWAYADEVDHRQARCV